MKRLPARRRVVALLALGVLLSALPSHAQKPVYHGSKISGHTTSPFVGIVAHTDSVGPMLVALAENGDVYVARGIPWAEAWFYVGNVIDGAKLNRLPRKRHGPKEQRER